jgi:hypothetical protein
MFDVPWNVPAPVRLNGHVTPPFDAVPVAAHGIVVSPCVAVMVPASVTPSEQVAVKSPDAWLPDWDVIFHCSPLQLCAAGATADPFHVPMYDRTSPVFESGPVGELKRFLIESRPRQAVEVDASAMTSAVLSSFMPCRIGSGGSRL